jgi:phenylacetate-CoA ligase
MRMAASPLLLLQAHDAELFCPRRLPALGDGARRLLKWMREHPQAPRYRNYSGHRLNAGDVAWVRARSREIEQAQLPADPLAAPAWLQHHLAACWRHVPYWRSRGTKPPAAWHDVPCTSRAELSADIARFVPDDAALDRMICFTTSGTTGHPLKLPSHPRVAALYAAHHRRALRLFGIEPRAGVAMWASCWRGINSAASPTCRWTRCAANAGSPS